MFNYNYVSKILPLVYNDSLSYYETICILAKKLDEFSDIKGNIDSIVRELLTDQKINEIIETVVSEKIDRKINVRLLGFDNTGENPCDALFNQYRNTYDFYFPEGVYTFKNILYPTNNLYGVSNGNGEPSVSRSILDFKFDNTSDFAVVIANNKSTVISGITFNCNSNYAQVKTGLRYYHDNYVNCILENSDVLGAVEIGIDVSPNRTVSISRYLNIKHCFIASSYLKTLVKSYNSVGIRYSQYAPDSWIDDCLIMSFLTGIDANCYLNVDKCHIWNSTNNTSDVDFKNWWNRDNNIAVKVTNRQFSIGLLYADCCRTVLFSNNAPIVASLIKTQTAEATRQAIGEVINTPVFRTTWNGYIKISLTNLDMRLNNTIYKNQTFIDDLCIIADNTIDNTALSIASSLIKPVHYVARETSHVYKCFLTLRQRYGAQHKIRLYYNTPNDNLFFTELTILNDGSIHFTKSNNSQLPLWYKRSGTNNEFLHIFSTSDNIAVDSYGGSNNSFVIDQTAYPQGYNEFIKYYPHQDDTSGLTPIN